MTTRYKINLTRPALDDLSALRDYVTEHRSDEQAQALIDKLLDVIASLDTFPLRGPVPKELEVLGVADFRQLLLWPYRIFYEIVDRRIDVLLVTDGRRDMAALLTRRLLNR